MVLSKTQSCSSSEMGDHIGMESCVDIEDQEFMMSERIINDQMVENAAQRRNRRWDQMRSRREKKEYPPPIPWLARTENLPSHMPWVMKRYYTTDGRLVIKEERVKHHEYFRAHRSNGRLTLHLVPLNDDDAVLADHNNYNSNSNNNNNNNNNNKDEFVTDLDEEREEEDDDDDDGDVINEDREDDDVINEDGGCDLVDDGLEGGDEMGGGVGEEDRTVVNGGGKCYSTTASSSSASACNSVRKSSCLVGMVVPAIRPVHI